MWFFWWWSLQRGQLNKSPCGCKKTLQNLKKIPNSIKLDPLSCPLIPVIFIKRYTRSIIFVTFHWKLSNSWIYSWIKLVGDSLKMSTKYCATKSEKLPISPKYVLESFPFTPYIFIKRYTWSINFETIHWKLSITWTYSKINLAS